MINFDQFIHHNISTPDSFSSNDLNKLHVNISDDGDFQLHDIHVPFMLLLEIFNENEDFYNVFMLSQNTFHTLQTKNKLVYSPRPYSLHKHSCIEIMYVISGEVTNHVENQIYTYKAGQFCVMNKNIYHCEEFIGNFQAIFFMLRDDFMLDLLKEYYDQNSGSSTPIEMNLIYHLIEDSQHSTRKFDKEYLDYFPVLPSHDTLTLIESIIHFIIQELQYPQTGSSFFIKGTFARMFQSMNDPSHYISNRIRSDSTSQEFLFKKITHIIRSNHGRCTRESLAAQLHYNGEYLNRIMKKYTGKTILEYGRSIYLEEARQMLSETTKSISSIIEELGFANRNYFYHLFKQTYGETPMDYRKNHCK